MQCTNLPNLSSPQHVTLPPMSALRVELLPATVAAAAVCFAPPSAMAQACWSPTEMLATWHDEEEGNQRLLRARGWRRCGGAVAALWWLSPSMSAAARAP